MVDREGVFVGVGLHSWYHHPLWVSTPTERPSRPTFDMCESHRMYPIPNRLVQISSKQSEHTGESVSLPRHVAARAVAAHYCYRGETGWVLDVEFGKKTSHGNY